MVEQDEQQKPIDALKEKRRELTKLFEEKVYQNSTIYAHRFRKWYSETEYIIESIFGEGSREFKNFANIAKSPTGKATEQQWIKYRRLTLVKADAELGAILSVQRILGEPKKRQTAASQKASTANDEVNNLFDRMKLHPDVIEASESLFKDGHYASAILEAFKAVNNFVKQKTGKPLDGKSLMSEVFSEKNPCIKLNELKTQSDIDEQEGFKFLYMGAMVGIRNPKAHDRVQQKDPYKALEYLTFASLLIKRIDFWQAD